MRYYIFDGCECIARTPTHESAMKLVNCYATNPTCIIRGEEEELIPCKGKRHEKVTPEEKHRYYYVIRDGRFFRTVTSRKAAMDSIRAMQAQEDHYLLTSSYSIIYGDAAECLEA